MMFMPAGSGRRLQQFDIPFLSKIESFNQAMRILHITNNFPTLNFPIFGIFIKEQIESLNKLGAENEVFFINSREEGKGSLF